MKSTALNYILPPKLPGSLQTLKLVIKIYITNSDDFKHVFSPERNSTRPRGPKSLANPAPTGWVKCLTLCSRWNITDSNMHTINTRVLLVIKKKYRSS